MQILKKNTSACGHAFLPWAISLVFVASCGSKQMHQESDVEFSTFEQEAFYSQDSHEKAQEALAKVQDFSILKKVHEGIKFDIKVAAKPDGTVDRAKDPDGYFLALKQGDCVGLESAKKLVGRVFSAWLEVLAKSEKEGRVSLESPLVAATFDEKNPDVVVYFICSGDRSRTQYSRKTKYIIFHLDDLKKHKNKEAIPDPLDPNLGFAYAVLAHEVGHVFGLGDAYGTLPRNDSLSRLGQSPRSIMNYHFYQANITFEDQMGLTWLYQHQVSKLPQNNVSTCPAGYQFDNVSKGCIFGWSGYEQYLPDICRDAGGIFDSGSNICTCQSEDNKYTIDLLSDTRDCFFSGSH